jgi:hypothetical protein
MVDELSPRSRELLEKFSRRLDVTPFTVEGVPPQEEVDLIKDLWAALTDEEKKDICVKVGDEVFGDSIPPEKRPDVTPYAMRLTLKYLKLLNRKLG